MDILKNNSNFKIGLHNEDTIVDTICLFVNDSYVKRSIQEIIWWALVPNDDHGQLHTSEDRFWLLSIRLSSGVGNVQKYFASSEMKTVTQSTTDNQDSFDIIWIVKEQSNLF